MGSRATGVFGQGRFWAGRASNVILLGPPGVGKTHLGVALAEAAIQAGFGAYFITAHQLVGDLGRAYREGRLDRRMRIYLAPKVLVVDEMGATIFFQLVSARYEKRSIVLTSNKSYGDWGSVFGDPVVATAILDRLLHHSTKVNIRGESYRLKERRKAGLFGGPAAPPAGPASFSGPAGGWGIFDRPNGYFSSGLDTQTRPLDQARCCCQKTGQLRLLPVPLLAAPLRKRSAP